VIGLVGAPLLYVLGAGPLEYWEVRNALGSSSAEPPECVVKFFRPAVSLCQNEPLNKMMEPYLAWWVRKGAEKS
jgi:hypothetical protein